MWRPARDRSTGAATRQGRHANDRRSRPTTTPTRSSRAGGSRSTTWPARTVWSPRRSGDTEVRVPVMQGLHQYLARGEGAIDEVVLDTGPVGPRLVRRQGDRGEGAGVGRDELTEADPAVPGAGRRAPSRPVFAVLDPLRAVGALAVLVTHATFWTGDYVRHGVLGSVLARLDVGVAIFFVLSGFLLSHHYLSRAWNREPAEPTGRYFWKRFLRIYPAYVVAVVAGDGLRQGQLRRHRRRTGHGAADGRHLRHRHLSSRPDPDVEPGDRGLLLRRAARC